MTVQPELFEPAPTRRLIVPRGHESHWGVDVSTKAVSVGWVGRLTAGPQEPLQRGVLAIPWPASDDIGRRLSAAREAITYEVQSGLQYARLPRPGFVFVEQPGFPPNKKTRQPIINWPLILMLGVVVEAIQAGCGVNPAYPPPRCELIAVPTWKRTGCGRGNLYKNKPSKGDYGVYDWAVEHGYEGHSWDDVDAWGIAEAARRTVLLEPR